MLRNLCLNGFDPRGEETESGEVPSFRRSYPGRRALAATCDYDAVYLCTFPWIAHVVCHAPLLG